MGETAELGENHNLLGQPLFRVSLVTSCWINLVNADVERMELEMGCG